MGQPGRSQGRSSLAREKRTRRTETSQYPEEEKATAIPLVAASERGPAQTRRACTPGVVGPRHGSTTPSRSGLRSEERRVGKECRCRGLRSHQEKRSRQTDTDENQLGRRGLATLIMYKGQRDHL